MAASALEDTHDSAASTIALELTRVPESPNRRIAWAIALSALLHAVLLLSLGLSGRDSTRPNSARELSLNVELQSGRDTEHDQAGSVERPAAPTVKPREEFAAASGSRWSNIQSPPGTTVARVSPAQNDTTNDGTPADGSVQRDSPPEETTVVTTQGDSDRQAAARAEGAGQEQEVALSKAQQSRLAQWVIRAAQGLQDANLRQARLSLEHQGRRYVAVLERRPAANDMDIEHRKWQALENLAAYEAPCVFTLRAARGPVG